MARRSPMNERYQKNTAPAGKTRKSAASAKPKRTGDAKGSSKTKAKPSGSSRTTYSMNPPTEEYRKLRRIWWILLGASLLLVFASLAAGQWLKQPVVANVLVILAYVGMFGAFFLDWTKLRGMRKEWVDQQKSGKVPNDTKPAKKSADKAAGDEAAEGSSAKDES